MDAEYIQKVKDTQISLERYERFNRLRLEANELNRTRRNELVDLVNNILQAEGCPLINNAHIKFYPQYVGNTGFGDVIDQSLTRIIYNYYYPAAKNGEYAHFTDLTALDSILKSKKIRLTSTIKRKDDKEYKLFYEDANITGFKRPYNIDFTVDENLMRDLFYISLTKNQDTSVDIKRGMWQYFGRGGYGVKLVFDIDIIHSDFREVCYAEGSKQLLKKLNDEIGITFDKPLVFNSISKIGSFYIHEDFKDEFETRILVKNGSDDYPFPFKIFDATTIPYIELDFEGELGKIMPVKIQPGMFCNRDDVQKIVESSGLNIQVLPNATSL